MPLDDYYFNAPVYMAFRKQEIYATGIFADCVRGVFPPGFYGNVKVGQLPANETVSPGYKVADTYDPSIDFDPLLFTYGLYDRQTGTNSNITMADGVTTRPYETFKSYSLPYIQPPSGISDPRGTWDALENRVTDSFGMFSFSSQLSSNFGLAYNTLATAYSTLLLAQLNRLPGTVSEVSVENEWLIELTGIFYVQIDMTPSEGFSESLGRLYHAGWVAFGHR